MRHTPHDIRTLVAEIASPTAEQRELAAEKVAGWASGALDPRLAAVLCRTLESILPFEDSDVALEAQLNAITELSALGLAPADSIARAISARPWDEPWSAEYIEGLRSDLPIAPSTDPGAPAGLVLLGEIGTPEEVQAAWRPFVSVDATPFVRVSNSLDEASLVALTAAWNAVAHQVGMIPDSGEFLLSASGKGSAKRAWSHVRADHCLVIRDLGLNSDEPEFVGSSLDRSVSIAVTAEEYEFWILVAQNKN